MKSYSDVLALIPAWNEESTIEEVVRRTRALIPHVLVIDDGSIDNTAALASKAGAKVISHTINLGKGEALNTGLQYALKSSVNYIVVIDADLQFKPEDAPKLLEPLKSGNAELVMGARDFSKLPFRHRLGNYVWRSVFNLLFCTRFPDTNCGYFAFSRSAAECIKKFHGGYIIETDLLIKALKCGLKIVHVPVSIEYRVRSNVPRGIRIVLGVLLFILAEWLKLKIHRV